MKSPRRSAAGFSLVELLIASIIVAAGGTLLAGGLVTSNRGAQLRSQQILVTQALASQLAQLNDQVVGASGQASGAWPPPLETIRWTKRWEPAVGPMEPLAQVTLAFSDGTYTAHAITYRPVEEPQ